MSLEEFLRRHDPRGEDVIAKAIMLYAANTPQPQSGGGQARWWRDMAVAAADALENAGYFATSPSPEPPATTQEGTAAK